MGNFLRWDDITKDYTATFMELFDPVIDVLQLEGFDFLSLWFHFVFYGKYDKLYDIDTRSNTINVNNKIVFKQKAKIFSHPRLTANQNALHRRGAQTNSQSDSQQTVHVHRYQWT